MKHFYELEWTSDLKVIWDTLLKYYISLPSIVDDESTSKLPTVFKKIQEAYENPYNPERYNYHFQQVLWFDRITEPNDELKQLLNLFDHYKIRHSVNFFHMSSIDGVTSEFLPHRHMPGATIRGTENREGQRTQVAESTGVGEKGTIIETTQVQLTFPFINSSLGETQWSSTYDEAFKDRRRFHESEVTGRYTLTDKPVLFDVENWHQGRNMKHEEDRLLVGLPTNHSNVEEAASFFLDRAEKRSK